MNTANYASSSFCKAVSLSFPLGLIENNEQLKFHLQIFIDSKPEHYSFANKTELMTEAEVIAKYTLK